MVQYEPTHSVTHIHGWQANLYIASSLQSQLQDPNALERAKAEKAICIRFKHACEKKFPDEFSLTRVEIGHITLTALPPMADPTVYPRTSPVIAKSASPTPVVETHCCDNDDCVPCDIGYHSMQCREGCTMP